MACHLKEKNKIKKPTPISVPDGLEENSHQLPAARKLGFCFLSPEFQARKGQTSHGANCGALSAFLIARLPRFAIPARSRGCHACRIHSWPPAPDALQAEPTHAGGRGHGSSLPCRTPSHHSFLEMCSISHVSPCCRHRSTSLQVLRLLRGLSKPPGGSPTATCSGHGQLPSQFLAQEVKRGLKKN